MLDEKASSSVEEARGDRAHGPVPGVSGRPRAGATRNGSEPQTANGNGHGAEPEWDEIDLGERIEPPRLNQATPTASRCASIPMGSGRTGCARPPAASMCRSRSWTTLNAADAVMTLKNYYRQQPQPAPGCRAAQHPDLHPAQQHRDADGAVPGRHLPHPVDPVDVFDEAMRETQEGIQRVLNGAATISS